MMKWIRVLCDKCIPTTKPKEEFYKIAIRTIVLQGSECWAIKNISKK